MARQKHYHLFGWCATGDHLECKKTVNGSTGVFHCDCACHSAKGLPPW